MNSESSQEPPPALIGAGLEANRFRTGVMVALSILIALGNAAVSFVLVVLAIPGSGEPGAGFKTIAGTFLVGNAGLLLIAIRGSRSSRRRTQILAIAAQLFTVPACIAAAMIILFLAGVSDL